MGCFYLEIKGRRKVELSQIQICGYVVTYLD